MDRNISVSSRAGKLGYYRPTSFDDKVGKSSTSEDSGGITPTDSGYAGSDTSPSTASPTGRKTPKLKLIFSNEQDIGYGKEFDEEGCRLSSPFAYAKRSPDDRAARLQASLATKKSQISPRTLMSPASPGPFLPGTKRTATRYGKGESPSMTEQLQLSLSYIFNSKPFIKPKVISLKHQLHNHTPSSTMLYDHTIYRLNKVKKKSKKSNRVEINKANENMIYIKNLRMGKISLSLSDIEEEDEEDDNKWLESYEEYQTKSRSFMELVFDERDDVDGLVEALSSYNFMYELLPEGRDIVAVPDCGVSAAAAAAASEAELDPVIRINNRQSMRRARDNLTKRIRAELTHSRGVKSKRRKEPDGSLLTPTTMLKSSTNTRKTMQVLLEDSVVK